MGLSNMDRYPYADIILLRDEKTMCIIKDENR